MAKVESIDEKDKFYRFEYYLPTSIMCTKIIKFALNVCVLEGKSTQIWINFGDLINVSILCRLLKYCIYDLDICKHRNQLLTLFISVIGNFETTDQLKVHSTIQHHCK